MRLRQHAILTICAILALGFKPAACIFEDEIKAFLEEFRARMCHPIPNLGLPALDPLQIEHREISADNQYLVNFSASVDNFKLTGLSDFVINRLRIQSVPALRSTVEFTLPLTAFKSLYTAKGSLAYILNLAGDGNAEASLEELRITISWILKAGVKLGIRGFQFDLHLGGLKIDFENLLEEERINEFFHALINELGLELLTDIWSEEHETVQKTLENKINDFIGQYTLADIVKLITGGGGEGESAPIFEGVPADCKNDDISIVLLP